MQKNCTSVKEILRRLHPPFPCLDSPDLLQDGLLVALLESALADGSGVFPSQHHPPWLSILICHMGNEQQARWWPQFRDIILPHQHNRHHQLMVNASFKIQFETSGRN
jgi:hypothetical protein